jgi:hypothetical protein
MAADKIADPDIGNDYDRRGALLDVFFHGSVPLTLYPPWTGKPAVTLRRRYLSSRDFYPVSSHLRGQ